MNHDDALLLVAEPLGHVHVPLLMLCAVTVKPTHIIVKLDFAMQISHIMRKLKLLKMN